MTKISISELVKRAGVSRAAFYRNYDSKEEILESVFKRSVHNIMEQLHHYDVKDRPLSGSGFTFSEKPRKEAKSDSTCPRLPSGKNLCPSHAGVSGKIPWKIKRCQLLPSFLWSSAIVSVLLKWIKDGMKVPAEKIADLRLPFLKNREKGEKI